MLHEDYNSAFSARLGGRIGRVQVYRAEGQEFDLQNVVFLLPTLVLGINMIGQLLVSSNAR